MRKFLSVLVLLVVVSGVAEARSPMLRIFKADLIRFNVDEKLGWGRDVSRGNVVINYNQGTVRLTLFTVPVCQPGQMCPRNIDKRVVELPITSIETDTCKMPVVTAMRDLRRVDGAAQRLVVRDYTKSECKYFRAVPATEVTYSTVYSGRGTGGVELRTHSTFDGDRLLPMYRAELND